MRHVNLIWKLALALAIVVLAVSVSSATNGPRRGMTWQQPLPLDLRQSQFSAYHQLHSTGDAVYYRTTVPAATRVRFRIMIPESSSSNFAPQVVLFQPYAFTVGPVLPIEQPPDTIALAYGKTPPKMIDNSLTQTRYVERLNAEPEFSEPGTYIVAVYNAGRAPGQFRMMLDHGVSSCRWSDLATWPQQWWLDQSFAGFSWRTLIAPGLLALGFWAVYGWLDIKQLHPHKRYQRSKPPSKRKKTS